MLYRPKQGCLPERYAQAEPHNPHDFSLRRGTPERDDMSPKTRALHLSEMLEQNQVRVSAIFA